MTDTNTNILAHVSSFHLIVFEHCIITRKSSISLRVFWKFFMFTSDGIGFIMWKAFRHSIDAKASRTGDIMFKLVFIYPCELSK